MWALISQDDRPDCHPEHWHDPLQDWQSLRQAWNACSGHSNPDTTGLEAAAAAGGLVLPAQADASCSSLGRCQRLFAGILPGAFLFL